MACILLATFVWHVFLLLITLNMLRMASNNAKKREEYVKFVTNLRSDFHDKFGPDSGAIFEIWLSGLNLVRDGKLSLEDCVTITLSLIKNKFKILSEDDTSEYINASFLMQYTNTNIQLLPIAPTL